MTSPFKDLFISYGRRESLGFVGRLHQQLKLVGYEAWFDKVNIPDGNDYQQRINHGIESAHNFVYVMAPRCLTSPYCLIELEYARWLGKRVIPLNQMVIFATDSKALSDGDKQVLQPGRVGEMPSTGLDGDTGLTRHFAHHSIHGSGCGNRVGNAALLPTLLLLLCMMRRIAKPIGKSLKWRLRSCAKLKMKDFFRVRIMPLTMVY
jgi:hypothetical protein